MIPPQLALLAAKHGKKLAIGLVVLIVIAGVWFAVKMHERTVDKLARSEAAQAAQVVAHEVTLASLGVQREVAARWKASAAEYREVLSDQVRVRDEAARESRRLRETLTSGRLGRLARAKPELLERTVNRGTARIIGMLNCSSTASGCDGDRGTPGSDTARPISATTLARNIRVDGDGAGVLARPRQSLLLPRPVWVRSSGT